MKRCYGFGVKYIKKEYQKKYRQDHKEQLREYRKKYYREHKEQIREQKRIYYQEHNEYFKEKTREYSQKHKDERREFMREWRKKYYQDIKMKVLEKLGGKCSNPNCLVPNGCKDIRCLQIDHVHNDGAKERKEFNNVAILKKVLADTNGNYQLFCANCNWIKTKSESI